MPADCETLIEEGNKGTIDDPFRMFSIIQGITDNPDSVSLATKQVIKEFAEDGVKYLELRSTPRAVAGRMTKQEYCEAILKEVSEQHENIVVRLILAVDRRRLEELDDTVDLYRHLSPLYPGLLVGIDISGDPRVGDLVPVLPKLRSVQQSGIPLAVHLAEVPNIPEVEAVLQFLPDRIGHGTCIHPSLGGSHTLWDSLVKVKTPVEVCLTSNTVCGTVPSVKEHQAGLYYAAGIPIILCTDDKGVFCCSLSGEYYKAASAYGWDRDTLYTLSRSAIQYSFASVEDKAFLYKLWDSWYCENKHIF